TSSEVLIETVKPLEETQAPEIVPYAISLVTPNGRGHTVELLIDGKSQLSLRGDDGTVTSELARKINELKRAGNLRPDRIRPSKRDGKYVVLAGEASLLTVTRALAKAENTDRFSLTLMVVNRLRAAFGGVPFQQQASRGGFFHGIASWYGGFFHGRRAANGERFDQWAMTAAHKTLPFGTLLLVTNTHNNQSAIVRVTDRGPFIPGRTIDLSQGAASAIGMLRSGIAKVKISILGLDEQITRKRK
ncbi:MAG TPA: septal ring lytic transglycosylase RlpA family protein, partial [Chroococcales cyanobacterium]